MNPAGPQSAPEHPDATLVAPIERTQRRLRILVVDDDMRARTVIAAGLKGDGHDVHLANDGPQALSLHARDPFDVVVADLLMPGMSGHDLAAGIKRMNPRTPVLLVTGQLQELPNSPCDLVIRKPFAHSVLRAALEVSVRDNSEVVPAKPGLPDGALIAPVEKPLRSLRILVVDDDPSVRTVIAAGLRGDGHEVQTFHDGAEALACHLEQPFDAIVADLVMPGMSGRELASAIKEMDASTPVILVTGYPQELKDSPFDLIIRKPFAHSVLRAALDLFCA